MSYAHPRSTRPDKSYPPADLNVPEPKIEQSDYRVSFAGSPDQLDEILRLRFEVFNLEMNEGMEHSYITGRDQDEYDGWMHHLYVRHTGTGEVVGTYRMQHHGMALQARGYYTDEEFELSDQAPAVAREGVEIGRACVRADHRNGDVFKLLWKGIAYYLDHFDRRYLFGCTSVPTLDRATGEAIRQKLSEKGYYHDELLVPPRPEYRFDPPPVSTVDVREASIPRLLLVYVRYGATICSPPARDENFQTLDFLTVFDLEDLPESARRRFFQ